MTTGLNDLVPSHASRGQGEYDIGVLRDVIVFRLRRIRNHMTESFRAGGWRDGLKPGEFTTLALIVANPGISQIDLARVGGFDQTSLVGIMDDLERRGWAGRAKDPDDRRRHRIVATAAGREALDGLMARAQENERPAREALTPAELDAFMNALDKIYHRLLDPE
ncbi:MarR family transcriptional regulator [Sphingomonas gilva]|uniref:MarR family transcriptional regulator n=1 Tax=Sphingomonas gilva TaxID=2305907 RepID=A0A396RT48_9SPHN|nr:MarR family winged helix-turn-helix transcriptional regulator [Sphingomonas gilva]RHW19266.1 MarR family transcriptional regulator [Sphingomonas gilva]